MPGNLGVRHRITGQRRMKAVLIGRGLRSLDLVYAALAKLPLGLKGWLAAVAVICTLHALSLEWLAWGKEHMRLVGLGRSSSLLPILGHSSQSEKLSFGACVRTRRAKIQRCYP
jgi:hypothetical protein